MSKAELFTAKLHTLLVKPNTLV